MPKIAKKNILCLKNIYIHYKDNISMHNTSALQNIHIICHELIISFIIHLPVQSWLFYRMVSYQTLRECEFKQGFGSH